MSNTVIENKEVEWNVLGIPVCGTITGPADRDSHPAVVFHSGSGPTDRNWCSPLLQGTNGSGQLLAEALARQGFITLRFDKLGSGPHVKEDLPKLTGKVSMQTHTDQLAGAVKTILEEKNVNKDNLFALTNSEGAIHAVNYQLQAKNNRFKGLVLTGAPGRSVGDVARSQILEQFKSLPKKGVLVNIILRLKPLPGADLMMKHYDEAITEFLAGKPIVPDPSLPQTIKQLLLSLETPANQPFSRELWSYSLPEHIVGVNEPILVVIGKKDIQVDWKVDGKALENATAQKGNVSFVYPENANHILKHEEAPREKLTAQYVSSHYNAPGTKLDQEAVNAIISWLKNKIGV